MLITSSIILNIILSELLSLSHYPVVNILAIHFLIHYFSKEVKIEVAFLSLFISSYFMILSLILRRWSLLNKEKLLFN